METLPKTDLAGLNDRVKDGKHVLFFYGRLVPRLRLY